MTNSVLTEEDLSGFEYKGVSIQKLPYEQYLLIVMFQDKEKSIQFLNIINNYQYNLTVIIDGKTGVYKLIFNFIDSDLTFVVDTGKTEENYPPIEKFNNNGIHYISTGIWTGHSEQGRTFEHSDLIRLGSLNFRSSFQQAIGIQFVAKEDDNKPSAVVLTYLDHGHIIATEADQAYNKLLDFKQSRLLLEISTQDSEFVDIRIWDILVDLDIKLTGLKYSKEELDNFLSVTDVEEPFVLLLGFPKSATKQINIISTKSGDSEFLMIYGYKLSKM